MEEIFCKVKKMPQVAVKPEAQMLARKIAEVTTDPVGGLDTFGSQREIASHISRQLSKQQVEEAIGSWNRNTHDGRRAVISLLWGQQGLDLLANNPHF